MLKLLKRTADTLVTELSLSLTVADAAANSSTLTIQLMKGHAIDFTAATGGANNDADEAILNIISGTAIAD